MIVPRNSVDMPENFARWGFTEFGEKFKIPFNCNRCPSFSDYGFDGEWLCDICWLGLVKELNMIDFVEGERLLVAYKAHEATGKLDAPPSFHEWLDWLLENGEELFTAARDKFNEDKDGKPSDVDPAASSVTLGV